MLTENSNVTSGFGVLIIPVGLSQKTILKWTVLLFVVCDLKVLLIVRCVYNLKSATATSSPVIKRKVLQSVGLVLYP